VVEKLMSYSRSERLKKIKNKMPDISKESLDFLADNLMLMVDMPNFDYILVVDNKISNQMYSVQSFRYNNLSDLVKIVDNKVFCLYSINDITSTIRGCYVNDPDYMSNMMNERINEILK